MNNVHGFVNLLIISSLYVVLCLIVSQGVYVLVLVFVPWSLDWPGCSCMSDLGSSQNVSLQASYCVTLGNIYATAPPAGLTVLPPAVSCYSWGVPAPVQNEILS